MPIRSTVLAMLLLLSAAGCVRYDPPETPAQPVAFTVRVDGMTCDGCVSAVTAAVGQVEGVVTCDVSLEDGEARVEADPAARDAVVAAINDIGYTATPAESDDSEPAGG
jgi:copper chaperone CopZ